ncbi:MAG: Na(+)/H(+) antiporter subunit D, partial [Bauldia litoralis]
FLLMAASPALPIMAGIKFPWFVFFQKDSGLRPPDPPWTMRLAMILMAILCIGIGVFPAPLYAMLPFPVDFVPYTTSHVVSQLLLLLFAGLAFFLMLRWLRPTDTITLDVDWLWRRLGPSVVVRMDRQSAGGAMMNRGQRAATRALQAVYRHHGPTGVLARSWPTGSMAFWAVLMLSAYLVFYYL